MTDIKQIRRERGSVHGPYDFQFRTSQRFKAIAWEAQNERQERGMTLLDHVEMETVEMICVKLSRILCGNPKHKDHADDVSGYGSILSDHADGDVEVRRMAEKLTRSVEEVIEETKPKMIQTKQKLMDGSELSKLQASAPSPIDGKS